MTNIQPSMQGSKLRKIVTAGSADVKEITSVFDHQQDKKVETRMISIKHKRQLSPLSRIVRNSGNA